VAEAATVSKATKSACQRSLLLRWTAVEQGVYAVKRTRWLLAAALVLGMCCSLGVPNLVKEPDGEAYVGSQVSLKEIGQAMVQHQDMQQRLSPAVVTDKAGGPLYSWRVKLLPYLEEGELYHRFRPQEPWDSPHNRPLAEETPNCYLPRLAFPDLPGTTSYQVFVGPNTPFDRQGRSLKEFSANTILVAEAAQPVTWSKPADLPYDPAKPLPKLGGFFTRAVEDLWGRKIGRKPGFNVLFADGSVRFLRQDIDEAVLRSLITGVGSEQVDVSKLE
jgi:prepilin-type processing-associated H-X9-DG protein